MITLSIGRRRKKPTRKPRGPRWDVNRTKQEHRWDVFTPTPDGSLGYVGQWVGDPLDFTPNGIDHGRSR